MPPKRQGQEKPPSPKSPKSPQSPAYIPQTSGLGLFPPPLSPRSRSSSQGSNNSNGTVILNSSNGSHLRPRSSTTTTTTTTTGIVLPPPPVVTSAATRPNLRISTRGHNTNLNNLARQEIHDRKNEALQLIRTELKLFNNQSSSARESLDETNDLDRLSDFLNAVEFLFETAKDAEATKKLFADLKTTFGNYYDDFEEFSANVAEKILTPYMNDLKKVDIENPLPMSQFMPQRTNVQNAAIGILTEYTQPATFTLTDEMIARSRAKSAFLTTILDLEKAYNGVFMDKKTAEARKALKQEIEDAHAHFNSILQAYEYKQDKNEAVLRKWLGEYKNNAQNPSYNARFDSLFIAYRRIQNGLDVFTEGYLHDLIPEDIRVEYEAKVKPVIELLDKFLEKYVPFVIARAPSFLDGNGNLNINNVEKYYNIYVQPLESYIQTKVIKYSQPASGIWKEKDQIEHKKFNNISIIINNLVRQIVETREEYEEQNLLRLLRRKKSFLSRKKKYRIPLLLPQKVQKIGSKGRTIKRLIYTQQGPKLENQKMASFPRKPYFTTATRKQLIPLGIKASAIPKSKKNTTKKTKKSTLRH